MISQSRRDFTAEYTCEFCGAKEIDNSGYDDAYYHQNVIPNFTCKKCGKSTISGGAEVKPQATKYPEGMQV